MKRSIAGPLILILLGVFFLVYNLRPDFPLLDLVAVYWPFLLIAWGLIRVVEVVVSFLRGTPQRSGLSGGEVVLIVFICLAGTGLYSVQRHGFRLGMRGMQIFGDAYDFPLSAVREAGEIRRVVLENRRGNMRVTGSETREIKVDGHKILRALTRTDAERVHRDSPLEIVVEGESAFIRTTQERVSEDYRVAADLDVTVPAGVRVEMRGRRGDYEVNGVAGGLDIAADSADVRLARIGGDARIQLRRSGLIRAVDLKGNLDVQGSGRDIELENISGQVAISGHYSGALEFKNLAKPLRFESRDTDLRVQALPGRISMDRSEFAGRDLVGPVHLNAASRDVKIEDFTQALEVDTDRGDIEIIPRRLPLARIDARSRAGRIDLTLPPAAAFQLTASTDRGDAINEFGPEIQKETTGRTAVLKGKVGNGPAISLTTNRGTVTVRKTGVGKTTEI